MRAFRTLSGAFSAEARGLLLTPVTPDHRTTHQGKLLQVM